MNNRVMALSLVVLVTVSAVEGQESRKSGPERFEKEIARFDAAIASGKTQPGGVLFLGSSSIRRWKLKDSFPDLAAVNHGFGGSQISDSIHFFDRAVKPVQPRTILLYAGDNDINAGKSPEVVLADFNKLCEQISSLPTKPDVGFIAIKPSTSRWHLKDTIEKANQLVRERCQADDRLTFIDVWTPMLNADGKPNVSLLVDDGLHMTAEGYQVWAQAVRSTMPAKTIRP